VLVRPATKDDLAFLRSMLYEASCWRPGDRRLPENVFAESNVARYLAGWGRFGDQAVVAEEGGELVGAAWYRLFRSEEPGYGFVGDNVPELTVGVETKARGRGVGEALLTELIRIARVAGYSSLSLSVEPANDRAVRLYRRCGFIDVGTNKGAVTMRLDLQSS